MTTNLGTHPRGDTFRRTFTLGNGWASTDFDEIKFTVRTKLPGSGDSDANALAQVTMTGGGITFTSPTEGLVVIPASETTSWPITKLYWDLQGTVDGAEPEVYTIQSGQFSVTPDVTRDP